MQLCVLQWEYRLLTERIETNKKPKSSWLVRASFHQEVFGSTLITAVFLFSFFYIFFFIIYEISSVSKLYNVFYKCKMILIYSMKKIMNLIYAFVSFTSKGNERNLRNFAGSTNHNGVEITWKTDFRRGVFMILTKMSLHDQDLQGYQRN